jgi:hypothetical protein
MIPCLQNVFPVRAALRRHLLTLYKNLFFSKPPNLHHNNCSENITEHLIAFHLQLCLSSEVVTPRGTVQTDTSRVTA